MAQPISIGAICVPAKDRAASPVARGRARRDATWRQRALRSIQASATQRERRSLPRWWIVRAVEDSPPLGLQLERPDSSRAPSAMNQPATPPARQELAPPGHHSRLSHCVAGGNRCASPTEDARHASRDPADRALRHPRSGVAQVVVLATGDRSRSDSRRPPWTIVDALQRPLTHDGSRCGARSMCAMGRARCSTWNASPPPARPAAPRTIPNPPAPGRRARSAESHGHRIARGGPTPERARSRVPGPRAIGAAWFPDAVTTRLPNDWRSIQGAVDDVPAAASALTDGIPSAAEEACHPPWIREQLFIGLRRPPTEGFKERVHLRLSLMSPTAQRRAFPAPSHRQLCDVRRRDRMTSIALGTRARPDSRPARDCVSTHVASRPQDFTRSTHNSREADSRSAHDASQPTSRRDRMTSLGQREHVGDLSSGLRTMRLVPRRIATA